MYFYVDCLQRQGKFGILWIAAFECTDFSKRSIQSLVKKCDIDRSCDDILRFTMEGRENSPRMNLYVTSHLLAGLARTLKEKSVLTLRDSARLFIRWGEIARTEALRDVRIRKLGEGENPEELAAMKDFPYLHGHHQSQATTVLHRTDLAGKRKGQQKVNENGQASNIIDANELAEILRLADEEITERYRDITMREVPPVREEIPDQGFGGSGLEDLAPVVQEALGEVKPEDMLPNIPIVPEATETVDIPLPVLENGLPLEPQIPEIEIQKPRDISEVGIEQVLAEMLEVEEAVPEEQEVVVRESRERKARDNNLEFSMDRIKKKCTEFQNLMRPIDPPSLTMKMEKKKIESSDWAIPDMLKIAAPLLPKFTWPPTKRNTIKLAFLQQMISQSEEVEEESMEVQQIRDVEHLEEISMHLRPPIGTPTPTGLQREGRVRATPSPSPIGKEVQRTSTELNVGAVLEPIAETAVIDASALLLRMSMEEEQEPIAQATEKEQYILEQETEPSPKRPRVDTGAASHSAESSAILENSEERMKSLIARVLRHKETVTFCDIAPPRTTSKRTAASLFSTLLDLEKRKVLVTQQEKPYGKINIHLV